MPTKRKTKEQSTTPRKRSKQASENQSNEENPSIKTKKSKHEKDVAIAVKSDGDKVQMFAGAHVSAAGKFSFHLTPHDLKTGCNVILVNSLCASNFALYNVDVGGFFCNLHVCIFQFVNL